MNGVLVNLGRCCAAMLLMLHAVLAAADYVPPQNLSPESSTIHLDRSYQDDAWMVYTYDIDTQGRVVNPRIITSNGVPAVEKAVLDKVSTMQFRPATRDGQPVQASADPVIFTWILDLPRDMSPSFRETWEAAWAYFKQGDYASVAPLAEKLGATPGRNAFEEVKYRILAASLASRGGVPPGIVQARIDLEGVLRLGGRGAGQQDKAQYQALEGGNSGH